MKRVTLILKSCILGIFLMSFAYGQRVQADATSGNLKFEIQSIHGKVVVDFKEFEAEVNFDPNDLATSTIFGKVKSSSLTSGSGSRDGSLRGKSYLNVEKFTYMTFRSKQIIKDGNGFKALGTMTIKGKSREFEMPFSFDGQKFKSSFVLKFTDYGVSGGGIFHGDDGKVVMELGAVGL